MKPLIFFLSLALLVGQSVHSDAQTAYDKALDYDAFLGKTIKENGLSQRLDYRQEMMVDGKKQTNIVYVYIKNKHYNIKVFIIKHNETDSLVTYPEQVVTNREVHRVCKTYFAKVFNYKEYPRYEYRGNVAESQPVAPTKELRKEPDWVMAATQMDTGKRGLRAIFHRMNPGDYAPKEAAIIRKMNRDFDVLHQAVREHAKANNLPIIPD